MKWIDLNGKWTCAAYTIHRGIKFFSVSYRDDLEYTLVNNHCESLSQAKRLAEHDWELRLKASAATGTRGPNLPGSAAGGIGENGVPALVADLISINKLQRNR